MPRKQIRLNKVSISDMLTHLRQQRRLAGNQDVWKTIFFETVTLQRREVRAWKSSKLQTWLQHAGTWKGTRQPQNVENRRTTAQPLPHAFADMLEGIFNRNPGAPTQPEQLDEPVWTRTELIDSLMIHLEQARFAFECGEDIGANKCAQPPPFLATDNRLKIKILQLNVGHKWLGCMLTAAGTQVITKHRLGRSSAPSFEFFFANLWILLDQTISISKHSKYFNPVVSSAACFGNGHRAIHNILQLPAPHFGCSDWKIMEIKSLDHRQKLVGLRLGTRFFIYGMNGPKASSQTHTPIHGFISHANTCGSWQHMFPLYLPAHRWSQRLLSWHPFGRVGRPRHTWESIFVSKHHMYSKYANLGSWREAAVHDVVWNSR